MRTFFIHTIRGLSISTLNHKHILHILVRTATTGVYSNFEYEITPYTKPSLIMNFLKMQLQCTNENICIAHHVSFEKVGITE